MCVCVGVCVYKWGAGEASATAIVKKCKATEQPTKDDCGLICGGALWKRDQDRISTLESTALS